ncbi:MAG: hypothetical protein N2203_02060 [Bacteroidia bacterium]|nr:hypothetical protein [Bacteroidia bacterium]
MKTIKKILIALPTLLLIVSCKKDPNNPNNNNNNNNNNGTNTNGKLVLTFEAMFGDSSFAFNKNYTTANGDTVKFSTFKYYISNITLTKTDNSTYTVPESYFLVNHSINSMVSFTLNNIPSGQYKSIKMLIGVDSARNVSGAQTGALDPSNGMFWSWTTGYIMLKLEGTSPQSGSTTKSFAYHIGGFSGPNNALKWITPSFNSATANVSSTATPEIHFKVDVSEIFKTPHTINLATTFNVMMPGSTAKKIADNYADMISVDHIHN